MAVFQFNPKVGKLIKKQQNKAKTEHESHFCLSVLIFFSDRCAHLMGVP